MVKAALIGEMSIVGGWFAVRSDGRPGRSARSGLPPPPDIVPGRGVPVPGRNAPPTR